LNRAVRTVCLQCCCSTEFSSLCTRDQLVNQVDCLQGFSRSDQRTRTAAYSSQQFTIHQTLVTSVTISTSVRSRRHEGDKIGSSETWGHKNCCCHCEAVAALFARGIVSDCCHLLEWQNRALCNRHCCRGRSGDITPHSCQLPRPSKRTGSAGSNRPFASCNLLYAVSTRMAQHNRNSSLCPRQPRTDVA
jgi:hypothetical protein